MPRLQYQRLAVPLEPSLTTPQNLAWIVQHPARPPQRYPVREGWFTQPLEPSLWTPQNLSWIVQHPTPVRRIVPAPPSGMAPGNLDSSAFAVIVVPDFQGTVYPNRFPARRNYWAQTKTYAPVLPYDPANLTFTIYHRGHHTISVDSGATGSADILHRGHHTVTVNVTEQ